MTLLSLAIPSKGRLKEQAESWFGSLGLSVEQTGGGRGYQATLRGMEGIDLRLMSAGEIAGAVLSGEVHLGITGHDLVSEAADDVTERSHLAMPLGFGRADVVVAVPRGWIDVSTMADLADVAAQFRRDNGRRLRVATKYQRLTSAWFAQHGVLDHRIVDSAGATEGAPAAGSAELIVDITTTGQTLAANDLKVLEDGLILKSEAWLVAGLGATWSTEALNTACALLDTAAAARLARSSVEIRLSVSSAEAVLEALQDVKDARILGAGATHIRLVCPRSMQDKVVAIARGFSGTTAIIEQPARVYLPSNAASDSLRAAISSRKL